MASNTRASNTRACPSQARTVLLERKGMEFAHSCASTTSTCPWQSRPDITGGGGLRLAHSHAINSSERPVPKRGQLQILSSQSVNGLPGREGMGPAHSRASNDPVRLIDQLPGGERHGARTLPRLQRSSPSQRRPRKPPGGEGMGLAHSRGSRALIHPIPGQKGLLQTLPMRESRTRTLARLERS
jgi:hypothetical protein